jgi:hypothetical protein
VVQPWLRFHIPLIEPDMQISRIRLSDKTSRLHPRHVVPKPAQSCEPEVPVKVREWISSVLASPDLVLEAQPPAQPHSGVVVDRPVRFGKRQFAEPPLHPIRLDVRELLAIHTRCALVGAALGIGMGQDVLAADLVVQGVEAIPGFFKRKTPSVRRTNAKIW